VALYLGAGAVPGAAGEVLFMQPSTVGVRMLLLAAALGLSSIIGAGLLMRGYQMGANASVALFDYSYLVWAALVSTALWGQAPTMTGLAGLVLIMLAGMVAIVPRRQVVADGAVAVA
jgi:drug/metabolite transporter (DMT)-like permease